MSSNDTSQDYIYRSSKVLPDGTRIFARTYGKRAFKIPVCTIEESVETK